jgi:hypothetical protein
MPPGGFAEASRSRNTSRAQLRFPHQAARETSYVSEEYPPSLPRARRRKRPEQFHRAAEHEPANLSDQPPPGVTGIDRQPAQVKFFKIGDGRVGALGFETIINPSPCPSKKHRSFGVYRPNIPIPMNQDHFMLRPRCVEIRRKDVRCFQVAVGFGIIAELMEYHRNLK